MGGEWEGHGCGHAEGRDWRGVERRERMGDEVRGGEGKGKEGEGRGGKGGKGRGWKEARKQGENGRSED